MAAGEEGREESGMATQAESGSRSSEEPDAGVTGVMESVTDHARGDPDPDLPAVTHEEEGEECLTPDLDAQLSQPAPEAEAVDEKQLDTAGDDPAAVEPAGEAALPTESEQAAAADVNFGTTSQSSLGGAPAHDSEEVDAGAAGGDPPPPHLPTHEHEHPGGPQLVTSALEGPELEAVTAEWEEARQRLAAAKSQQQPVAHPTQVTWVGWGSLCL
jgi:hypothetical protein